MTFFLVSVHGLYQGMKKDDGTIRATDDLKLKLHHAACVDDDDTAVDEANADAEDSALGAPTGFSVYAVSL